MNAYPRTLKSRAESALSDPHFDFIATYHAVADLRRLARQHPGLLDGATITALRQLLTSGAFGKVRQAYFLFREAASVMTDMAACPGANGAGARALASLGDLLLETRGSAHRGVAEALGSLPVTIKGPVRTDCQAGTPRTVTWPDLLAVNRLKTGGPPRYIGRSLVVPVANRNRLLVVKLARDKETAAGLEKEIRWMRTLRQPRYAVDCRFHVPAPVASGSHGILRIRQLPLPPPHALPPHPERLAIAFLAHRDYFVYPNHPGIDGAAACQILGRNAFLLGRLAAEGIIHDAPIPLFHNRTQRLRRDDQGRYQWFRAGRLDRWIDSCAFPNFGLSGLRDFEHLISFQSDSRMMYRHIGSHLFSLLLVAGSHFRGRDASRMGLDGDGAPVDARDLFDRELLASMIRQVFERYYLGFTGSRTAARPPVDLDRLVGRMVAEMGVDRHMTELLRRVDQQALTDREFHDFLMERGCRPDRIDTLTRGAKDILITSGPHLGDFNRQISLPELIESVAGMSAVCMAGRFTAERKAH